MRDFQWSLRNTFTMIEGNFEFYCSEILQNKRFPMIVRQCFHHGWRKCRVLLLWITQDWRISNDCWGILSPWLKEILSFTALKYSRIKDFQWLLGNTFTMVEEDFLFYCSELLQIEGFPMIVGPGWAILSPWLKNILSFTALKCPE